MRICLVSTELAPFNGWGVGASTAQAARALAAAGHEVHVLTEGAPGVREHATRPSHQRTHPGVTIHAMERRGLAALPHVPARATRTPLAVYETLRDLHARHHFKFIEVADFYGLAYFALQARRTLGEFADAVIAVRLHSPIFALRAINRQDSLNLNVGMVEHLEIEAIRAADLVLAPSRAMLDLVRTRTGDLGDRAAVVPYAFDFSWLESLGPRGSLPRAARGASIAEADPEAVSASDAPPSETSKAQTPELLFFGRLEYRKGVHLLVDAAQRLLERGIPLRVRIVGVDTPTAPGERPMKEWLRSRIAPAHAGAFLFQDNRPRSELGTLLDAAAVVCVPSLWDNSPNVCLEALACGKVVVAARAGGIPEIIEDNASGILFDPDFPESLDAALLRALRDDDLRARLAAGAPRRIRELCDPHSIAARTLAAVESTRPAPARPATPPQAAAPRPLVSVIIPFFNLSEHLSAALASVRAQTYTNIEAIILDDGSTEPAAPALLQQIQREWHGPGPLRVIRQENRGLSAARNAAVAAARGEWLVPLDADDMLDPRFIELALAAATRDPALTLVTSWMSCFEESPDKPTVAYSPIGLDRDLLAVANVASSCTALLRRDAVLAAGGYDESLPAFEDWDLYCTLAEREGGGHRAAVIPAPLIHNRIRPQSMLRSLDAGKRRALQARVRAKHPALALDPDRARRMIAAFDTPRSAPPRGGLRKLVRRVLGR